MKTIIAAIGALLAASIANAAEIKVISRPGHRGGLQGAGGAVREGDRAQGHDVFLRDDQRRETLATGEPYDLIIMSAPAIEEQIKEGKVVAGSNVDFANSGTGLAVRRARRSPTSAPSTH